MCYTQKGGDKQQWCKQTRTWTLKLVEERVGYLGRCHSHAWFEPWLQRCALAPSTRPAAVMQLPCIKSSLPCNLQTENEASHVVSWLEATIGSFLLSNNSFISPKKKSQNNNRHRNQGREGLKQFKNVAHEHTQWVFGERTLWEPTSSLSQVRFHPTFMNIRRAVCAGLLTINGYIMSQNKRAFLWREEPTWRESQLHQPQRGLVCECPSGGGKMEEMPHTLLWDTMTSDFIH